MKKLMTILLSVIMVMAMMPAMAFAGTDGASGEALAGTNCEGADCTHKAAIGTVHYDTLQAAVEAGGEITLLSDVKEDIIVKDGKTVVLDLNGKKITNVSSDTITVKKGSSLTVTGNGVVDNKTHSKGAVFNEGIVILSGGTYDRSLENGSDEVSSGGNSWYTLCNHGTMTINSGVTVQAAGNNNEKGRFSSLVENGYQSYTSTNPRTGYVDSTNDAAPSLTIKGGTFRGGLNTIKNDDGGTATIENGTFTNYYQAVVQNHNIATIGNGTFSAAPDASEMTGKPTYGVDNCGCGTHDLGTLTITGGVFEGADYGVRDRSTQAAQITISGGEFSGWNESVTKTENSQATIFISGGYFSDDAPSSYLAEDYITTLSDKEEYYCMVVKKTAANVELDRGDTVVSVPENIKEDEKGTVNYVASNVYVSGLNEAAGSEIQKITQADADKLVEKAKAEGLEGENITLYVQTYLDVKVKEYDTVNGKLTLDITPMVKVIASLAVSSENILEENSKVVQEPKKISVGTAPVWMRLEIPKAFAEEDEDSLYVEHKKDGKTYVYEGFVGRYEDSTVNYVTLDFNNPHGFSEFTITKDAPAARIDEVGYKTLQEAVNNVKNDELIVVNVDNDEDVVVNKEVLFSVSIGDVDIAFRGSISAGKGYKLSVIKDLDGNDVYKVTKDTSNTGGGTVIVTPGAQKPVITAENAKITLSDDGTMAVVKPEPGYELVDVTVNGVSKGKVDILTGLKTGDKVVVTTKKIVTVEDEIAAVKATKLVARSSNAKAPSGKKAIKVYWFNKDGSALNLDGYEIYRSTKKNKFGKKPIYTAKKTQYFNTSAKKGTRYYYKVRGFKEIGGEKVYTDFSLKAIRTAK